MPVTNWWTVLDGIQQITGGPFLWDGSSDWSPPPGQRAVNEDPTKQGYVWQPGAVQPPMTMTSLADRIAVLEARLATEARGVKIWPAAGLLLLGATSTQRVALKSAMPSAVYQPSVLLTGGPLAGSFSATATVVDARTVDVTIKAVIAATITANALTALVFADTP